MSARFVRAVLDRIPDRFGEVDDGPIQDREHSECGEHTAPRIEASGLADQHRSDKKHRQYEESDGLIPSLDLPAPTHDASTPPLVEFFRHNGPRIGSSGRF